LILLDKIGIISKIINLSRYGGTDKNMAKRRTGVEKQRPSRSRKTAKRLAIKRTMLEAKAKKRKTK
jgi:hypothetical protein